MKQRLEFLQKFSKILKKDTKKLFTESTQFKCKRLFYEKFELDNDEGKAFTTMLRELKSDLKDAGKLGDFEKRIVVVKNMSDRIEKYFNNKQEMDLLKKDKDAKSDLKEWKKELKSIQNLLDSFVESMVEKQKEIEKEIMTKQRMSGEDIDKVHKNLSMVEVLITADMKKVFGDALSSEGLKHKIKELGSLKRKIEVDIREKYANDPTLADQLLDLFVCKNTIYDCIRYTAMTEPEYTVKNYFDWDKKLRDIGYVCLRRKNFWLKSGTYKGINTVYCTPYGYYIEIQLHSKDSLDFKEETHKLYEERRSYDTSAERKSELESQEKSLAAKLQIPKDISKITDFENSSAFNANRIDTSMLKKKKLVSGV